MRKRRKKAGLCLWCPKRAAKGLRLCRGHALSHRARSVDARKAARLTAAERLTGPATVESGDLVIQRTETATP